MKDRRFFNVVFIFLFASLMIAQDAGRTYKVIVNKSNPATVFSESQITKFFLKKVTKWPNGERILPIDKTKKHPVRKDFSEEVIHRRAHAVDAYWHKLIFSGRGIPPPQVDSDSLIADYVGRHSAGIGYVAADYDISKHNVKVVQVVDG